MLVPEVAADIRSEQGPFVDAGFTGGRFVYLLMSGNLYFVPWDLGGLCLTSSFYN